LIEEAGGRTWTSEEAQRQHTAAIGALDRVDLDPHIREQLVALAEFIIRRNR
ncbi:polyprenyl synthetase family protein, partial [Streptomyces xinghaiensis]